MNEDVCFCEGVSADQNAFVRGRQILDASLIANEVVDYWLKRKEKGLVCKLDIEKAYDSISWSFLMKVLKKIGFGSRWMEWMWWCFSTAKFSVLINGVLEGFFSSSKGLRQGDPISPYLFILGMEVLSALIRRAVQGNFISGCRLRGRGDAEIMVSHLLFADNTIIFCEASKDQLTHLGWILAWFEAASRLRINLAKSELILVGEIDNIEEMAVELGCRIGSFPVKYLGLPLGARHKALSTWDAVEERMRRRLALWKRQYLSKGGRITLIKSTLASIPIYQMSIFRMPKSVVKRLEKLQRDFLWGGGSTGRKIHLINWKVVCTQKEKRGLGIRRMGLLNKALLGKWIWRFAVEKDVLWKKVIGVKHGLEGCGWKSKEVRGPFGVGVWKEILKEMSWCWNNMKFKVGRGTKIMFWTDHWCGNVALSQAFPQIFALVVCSNELVNDVWDPRLGQGGWNLRLARDSNDWELVLIEDLLFLLRDIRWLGPYGKSPLPYLGFSGCFQRRSKRRCSVGGALLWGRGVLFTFRLLGVGSGPLRAGERVLNEAGYVPSNSEKYPLGGIVSAIENAFHATPSLACSNGAVKELYLCFNKDFKLDLVFKVRFFLKVLVPHMSACQHMCHWDHLLPILSPPFMSVNALEQLLGDLKTTELQLHGYLTMKFSKTLVGFSFTC
ncbi:putative ribonuclease H protein [Vitis vinifera]|uniref:Putative ribonuclease H protein n=1 Tax=Vitis vinifera TaxID=29760 RepID=A0A438FB22_VITVI|nr:putative ribonuclease H protein [Vitis vinifera]